ncbi:transglycosylase domain-containing protein [Bacillus suaedaesalsae]|uniref:PBP1A family penicillin-binding protein n=1 Tax=Bacillus suaedaesalsae TaxID=2810349 RepID=A0ABS2DEB8_9BACI|nr:PBP1A family penicillin-binding protein [Bacillus suaedaesalsae]MBM6616797.1 PBP1A family penicillin-binding protein [Bacillus suaedaesalsae]
MEVITNERLKQTLKYVRALLFIGLFLAIFFVLGVVGVLTYAKVKGAPPLAVPQSTIYYGTDNSIIGESHQGQTRYWVPLAEISPHLVNATVAIEDKRFYDHNGFDYKRIVGAALADIRAMSKVQGASTISQQYARNLFLEHDKTWKRKMTEALYTLRLEMNYTKEQIIEGYLNTIYYGHGAYGIEAASQFYFNKSAKDLTLAEATMLSGIPKGPTYYSPLENLDHAKKRQQIILNSMVANEFISKKQAKLIFAEKLDFYGKFDVKKQNIAPYFQEAVKKALLSETDITPRMIEMGGLKIYTTLDPTIQEIAEEKMEEVINPNSEIQAAIVVTNPANGDVKALVGGRDFSKSQFNRATQARRQPGSTFKPFLYYTAVEQGFTPSTMLKSEYTTFQFGEDNKTYSPSNYNDYYANDSITLAQAIALSDNVYAVKTHMFLGVNSLIDTSRRLGITGKLPAVPSLALGTSTVKMIDMVNAYGIIANGGKKTEPSFIKKIVNHNGEVIYEKEKTKEQVLDKDVAFVTTHMMTGMFDEKLNDYTKVTGRTISDQLTRIYAGKSGTTKTDSWMIGYSPELVTGVWVGYDKDHTLDLADEKTYSKTIWAGVMEDALKKKPVQAFKPTSGVVGVYVNPDNGMLATEGCPVMRLTYFIEGTEPTEYCQDHLPHQHKKKKKIKEEIEEKGFFKKIFNWFD